jgi:hypothetical protein
MNHDTQCTTLSLCTTLQRVVTTGVILTPRSLTTQVSTTQVLTTAVGKRLGFRKSASFFRPNLLRSDDNDNYNAHQRNDDNDNHNGDFQRIPPEEADGPDEESKHSELRTFNVVNHNAFTAAIHGDSIDSRAASWGLDRRELDRHQNRQQEQELQPQLLMQQLQPIEHFQSDAVEVLPEAVGLPESRELAEPAVVAIRSPKELEDNQNKCCICLDDLHDVNNNNNDSVSGALIEAKPTFQHEGDDGPKHPGHTECLKE